MIALHRIAQIVGGTIVGDQNLEIAAIRSLENATHSDISFFADSKKTESLKSSRAGAVLISSANASQFSGNKVLVADPYLAYAKISAYFCGNSSAKNHISEQARIAEDAILAEGVSVGAFSSIDSAAHLGKHTRLGNGVRIGALVKIGEGVTIEDNVVIYPRIQIGNNCCISAGAIIGSSGFGYAPDGDAWEKIYHHGSVVVGDNVDIGANTTIDRGSMDNTVIENGVKLDNQIHIAHNVFIGENTIMAGFSGIAGSSSIGKRCKIGARASILGHLNMADDVTVLANSTVTRDINQAGEYGSMISVQPISRWRKNMALIHRLDKLAKKITRYNKKGSSGQSDEH